MGATLGSWNNIMQINQDYVHKATDLYIGPIFEYFLSQLHQTITNFHSDKDAKIFFVSRAGVRIKKLYELYLEKYELKAPCELNYLWISRLMTAKGIFEKSPEHAFNLFHKEFEGKTLDEFGRAISNTSSLDISEETLAEGSKVYIDHLPSFLEGTSTLATTLKKHFSEQSSLFEIYIRDCLGDSKAVLMIDSGWAGTAQTFLSEAYQDIDWWGAYFGRAFIEGSDATCANQMLGLIFEANSFDPATPETAFIYHRHFIESLLEPNAATIECFEQGKGKYSLNIPGTKALLNETVSEKNDFWYYHLEQYLKNSDTYSLSQIASRFTLATAKFAEKLLYPTQEDAYHLGNVSRSTGFGKNIEMPVLVQSEGSYDFDEIDARLKKCLWRAGQLAIEYPREMAMELQKNLLPNRTSLQNIAHEWEKTDFPHTDKGQYRVSIITRTMDRVIFLKRALESVANQKFQDYHHFIVCDGGNIEAVKETIEQSAALKHKITLIDNIENRGMEAASNIAISFSDSEFFVIHDDDDSWHPGFLKRTVEYLDSKQGQNYGAVITSTIHVSEEVRPDGIKIHEEKPYQDWVDSVSFGELACENFFAPICFLIRRAIYDEVGGYDESFPVLGDWDFNLRFLAKANIGVVKESLANYHHRDTGNVSLYGNSIIDGVSKHSEFQTLLRHKFLRSGDTHLANIMGSLVTAGSQTFELRKNAKQSQAILNHIVHQNHQLSRQNDNGINSLFKQADNMTLQNEVLMKKSDTLGNQFNSFKKRAEDDVWINVADDRWVLLILQTEVFKRKPKIIAAIYESNNLTQAIRECILGNNILNIPSPPDFNEQSYLSQNADITDAITNSEISSAYFHYYMMGRHEGRRRG